MLQIGKANWVNGEYYTGALDNLNIYGSAHTAEQIKEAYDSTKSCDYHTIRLVLPLVVAVAAPQPPRLWMLSSVAMR